MSAAPIVSSSPLSQEEFGCTHAKKQRRDNPHLSPEYLTCTASSFSDAHIRLLQNEYPHLSNPFLFSILESTNGKIDAARAVISQIVQVGIKQANAPNDNRGKRSRSALEQVEWDSDSSSCTNHNSRQEIHDGQSGDRDGCGQKTNKSHVNGNTPLNTATIDNAVNELIKSLQGVATIDQARERLKPAVENIYLMVKNELPCDGPSTLNRKTQKLLTRTIIHQSEAITAANQKVDRTLKANNELLLKVQDLEQVKTQLECDVKSLKNANSKLSYFIAVTIGQNGCDANRGNDNHDGDGSGSGFGGWGFNQSSFRSPDVF